MRSSLEHSINPNYTPLEIVLAVSNVMGVVHSDFYTIEHSLRAKMARNVAMYFIFMKTEMKHLHISNHFGLKRSSTSRDAYNSVRHNINSSDSDLFVVIEKVLGIIG